MIATKRSWHRRMRSSAAFGVRSQAQRTQATSHRKVVDLKPGTIVEMRGRNPMDRALVEGPDGSSRGRRALRKLRFARFMWAIAIGLAVIQVPFTAWVQPAIGLPMCIVSLTYSLLALRLTEESVDGLAPLVREGGTPTPGLWFGRMSTFGYVLFGSALVASCILTAMYPLSLTLPALGGTTVVARALLLHSARDA